MRTTIHLLSLPVALSVVGCQDIARPVADERDPIAPRLAITTTSTTGITIIDLESLGGSRAAHAYAINDRGQVTGTSACCGDNAGGGSRAFLWTERDDMGIVDAEALIAWGYDISNRTDVVGRRFKFSPVGLFPFLWTETGGVIDIGTEEGAANAVNLLGHVAGQSGGAFFWTPEEGLIDLPAGASGYATDVNDLDIVVGTSYASGFSRPFRWTAQEGLTHLGTLQGRATAINNRGQVVGDFGLRAFRWDATVGVTELSMLPGDLSSSATDITDAGHVVGWTSGASGQRAALWTADGQVFDLGTYPGDYRSQAHGINRRGIVVGESWEPIGVGTYRPRAVLWTLD